MPNTEGTAQLFDEWVVLGTPSRVPRLKKFASRILLVGMQDATHSFPTSVQWLNSLLHAGPCVRRPALPDPPRDSPDTPSALSTSTAYQLNIWKSLVSLCVASHVKIILSEIYGCFCNYFSVFHLIIFPFFGSYSGIWTFNFALVDFFSKNNSSWNRKFRILGFPFPAHVCLLRHKTTSTIAP